MNTFDVGVLLAWNALSAQALQLENYFKKSDFDKDFNMKKDAFAGLYKAVVCRRTN